MFVNRSVEEWSQDWYKEGCEVFDEDWLDFVDVACFVAVDFFHCFFEFVFRYMSECEGWDGVGFCGVALIFDVVVLISWYCLCGFVSNCNVVVIECVCDLFWVCRRGVFVCDCCWRGS